MSDQPKCDKCGLEITSGLMAAYCSQGRECELWPHSNGDVQLAGGELLMYRFWMDNTLEQIGLHIIEDRKRLERELAEARSVISDGAKQIDELEGALIEQTVRADEALEELGALAYRPVFDDGQDHDDGEPRVTGWECRICGALEPKLSTFDHLEECPLHKPLPEAPK